MLMRSGRSRRRGQALVEMAMLFPVLLLLFFGVYTAANFISNLQIAGQSTRAGARLGAETGNNGYVTGQAATPSTCMTSGIDPCIVDKGIITSVLSIAKGMNDVTSIDEIDIYESCGGACTSSNNTCSPTGGPGAGGYVANDPVDVYRPSGGVWSLVGTAGFTLDLRVQTHPQEAPLGIRLLYTFHAPAPMTFFNFQTSQYATECLSPIEQE